MKKLNKKTGFTLIELLVVISIISLLSSVALTGLSNARAKARDSKKVQTMIQLKTAAELYRTQNNAYPLNLTQLVSFMGNTDPNNYSSYTYWDPAFVSSNLLGNYTCGGQPLSYLLFVQNGTMESSVKLPVITHITSGPLPGYYCITY